MIAYMMSRFPVVSETFILFEILEMQRQGINVKVFPLRRVSYHTIHPEAENLLNQINFTPILSPGVLWCNVKTLLCSPVKYFRVLADVLRKTWGDQNLFLGAIVFFPMCVLLAEQMQKLNILHIHAHFASHPAYAAYVINCFSGIDYSFTAHGSDIHVSQKMLDSKLERARFAITVSDYNKEFMANSVGAELARKIRVVHCGVDPDVFQLQHHKRVVQSPAEEIELLCVASLREVKGHQYLIEACNVLCRKGYKLRCSLIGEGPLEQQLKEQVRQLGLNDNIDFLGSTARNTVIEKLHRADVVVLASVQTDDGTREGIPVALMEAMACGCAVVASRISGIPELVQDGVTGLLVDSGEPLELSNAIERIIEDPELGHRLGSAAHQYVDAEFNLRKNVTQLASFFKQNLNFG